MKNKETIESKVARALLEKEDEVEVAGVIYMVAPPSIATIIEVSALVAELPRNENDETVLDAVLRCGKDSRVLGKVCAMLILGAKRVREGHRVAVKMKREGYKWNWKKMRKVRDVVEYEVNVDEYEHLADSILMECSAKEIGDVIISRLAEMQIKDFFVLTTSLRGISLTKATREVGTQSGE